MKSAISHTYDNTKLNLGSVAFLIGMCFGGPLSNKRIPLYWWETNCVKKTVRGIITLGVYISLIFVFRTSL